MQCCKDVTFFCEMRNILLLSPFGKICYNFHGINKQGGYFMIIIGEKINGSIPAVAKAIAERDAAFIKARAVAQEEAGATFIDCCASVPEEVEVETLH